jgi:hypothetical protein
MKNSCDLHLFIKRTIKFVSKSLDHDIPVVKYMFKCASEVQNSVYARNVKFCADLLRMTPDTFHAYSVDELLRLVTEECESFCVTDIDRCHAMTVKELSMVRDRIAILGLDITECQHIISVLCEH